MHGCFTVSSASMVETLPTPPTEPEKGKEETMETTLASAESNEKQPMDTDSTSEGTTSDATTVSVNCTCFQPFQQTFTCSKTPERRLYC